MPVVVVASAGLQFGVVPSVTVIAPSPTSPAPKTPLPLLSQNTVPEIAAVASSPKLKLTPALPWAVVKSMPAMRLVFKAGVFSSATQPAQATAPKLPGWMLPLTSPAGTLGSGTSIV